MKLLPASLAAMVVVGALSGTALAAEARRTYIVQLAAEPAASYSGGVAGYAATQPAPGARFSARAASVQRYLRYLDAQQKSVAALVAKAPIVARYHTVYNGFAALLTDAEAAALRASPKVVAVHVDERRQLHTVSTPEFLGLTGADGVWNKTVDGIPLRGEDIVVGIIDGGVWPENPAYADRVDAGGRPVFTGGSLAYDAPPATWSGTCVGGEGFDPAKHCNNKLIGARFYNAGFLASGLPKHWSEFYSPRDSVGGPLAHGGHGSHTSSTAAGNWGEPNIVDGVNMGIGSGIAPRARVASYKVCWTYDDATATDGTASRNSCWTSDSVSAIDRAVADGVQVINYSISGSQTSVNDPVEQAFLRAATANVFVAVSGGNAGPANAVAHVSPWLTTVAASTHDRLLAADVTLGDGTKYTGASVNTTALPQTPLIRAEDAGLPGANADAVRLCFLPSQLDPAKVAGKIVICTRGTNARVDKSQAVEDAGGVGMILADNGAGLVADVHAVPSVHVDAAAGAAIKNYAVTVASPTAAIGTFYNARKPAPIMADFSSRGPNQGDANMLKPDVTAPGVDIIAGVSPDLTPAQRDAVAAGTFAPLPEWLPYQGTSMAAPHVAGVAALLRQWRPAWTPAAIKSALMTTAYDTLNDGLPGAQNGRLPWAQGAGHIDPRKALDPGLVYDAAKVDFIRYQCKVNRAAVVPASDCTTYGALDETYNYNLPSITVGAVVGSTTVTRRVRNVGSSPATYNATATLPGFTVVVTPATLTLSPGQSATFTVTLTPAGVADGQWSYGSLVWNDGVHVVRSPLTARTGKTINAPAQVTGTTVSGSRLITIGTNFSGRPSADSGLKDVVMLPTASLTPSPLSSAALRTACTAGTDTASIKVYPVTVPENTIVARFELRNQDTGATGDDNDLAIVGPGSTWVYSGNEASNEAVQIASPAAGEYKVCVLAYAGAATMTHRLSTWVVTTADATPRLRVALPGVVYSGSTATVGVAWNGLNATGRYVGGVRFKDAAGAVQATTVLRITPGASTPAATPTVAAKLK